MQQEIMCIMHLLFSFFFNSTKLYIAFIAEDKQDLNMVLHKSCDMFMAQCLKHRVVANNSKCALK